MVKWGGIRISVWNLSVSSTDNPGRKTSVCNRYRLGMYESASCVWYVIDPWKWRVWCMFNRVSNVLSNVVLPLPVPPMIATKLPAATSNYTLSKILFKGTVEGLNFLCIQLDFGSLTLTVRLRTATLTRCFSSIVRALPSIVRFGPWLYRIICAHLKGLQQNKLAVRFKRFDCAGRRCGIRAYLNFDSIYIPNTNKRSVKTIVEMVL